MNLTYLLNNCPLPLPLSKFLDPPPPGKLEAYFQTGRQTERLLMGTEKLFVQKKEMQKPNSVYTIWFP